MQTKYSAEQVRKGTLLLASVLAPPSVALIYIVATHWSPHPDPGDKVLLGFCSAGMVMLLLIWGKVWWARGFLLNIFLCSLLGTGVTLIGQVLKLLSSLLNIQEKFFKDLVPTVSAIDIIWLVLGIPVFIYCAGMLGVSEDVDAYFGKPYNPNG